MLVHLPRLNELFGQGKRPQYLPPLLPLMLGPQMKLASRRAVPGKARPVAQLR